MRTRRLKQFTSAVAAIGLLVTIAPPAFAAPVPSSTASLASTVASPVTQIHWRGHHDGGGAVAAGIIGGLVLGSIIAAQANQYHGPVYYGPSGYYGPGYDGWMNYCFSRYRSFDPASGTYLGYDGRRHYCR